MNRTPNITRPTTSGTNGLHLFGYILADVKLLLDPRNQPSWHVQQYRYSCRIGRPRVSKDRSVRPHLPLTVKRKLGRKHHQMTIAKWNFRTLLDRETTDIPESLPAIVAMELAKYNVDIVVLSEKCFHASGSLNDLEYTFYSSDKPNGERRYSWSRLCNKKADRNATSSE